MEMSRTEVQVGQGVLVESGEARAKIGPKERQVKEIGEELEARVQIEVLPRIVTAP